VAFLLPRNLNLLASVRMFSIFTKKGEKFSYV
jgi:hypothetical protein